MKRVIKIILIILATIFFLFIIYEEIQQRINVKEFCQQECKYDSSSKRWHINITDYFEKEGLGALTDMSPEEYFSEKGLDECIHYCKQIHKDVTNRLLAD